jgi:cytochrome c-type biogenesis protein CcmE
VTNIDEFSTPDAGELPELDLTPRTSAADTTPARKGGGRVYVIAIVCVILAVTGILVVKALGNATLYFYQANEAVAQKADMVDKRFRMLGNVDADTVQRTGDGVVFTVSYDGATVPVSHVGDPPELFKAGVPVVLEGKWSTDGSTFQSDRILVKHTEDYVEKNPDRKTAADVP